ncbi:MAG: alanine dehydrogenase [Chloroflexota bacterium]
MHIGIPREVKEHEYRVAATPGGVADMRSHGHEVLVEHGAGEGSGFTDREYAEAGAEVVAQAAEVFARADMVLKVKEPLPSEYGFLREGLILFTYLHLAGVPGLARALLDRGVVAIGYETVEKEDGSLPLLTPMSEVAGRLAPQIGAHYLERMNGGRGVLLGGVPGVPPADVVIVGAGTVGINAARVALGLGAMVTVLDIRPERLVHIDQIFDGRLTTLASSKHFLATALRRADLLIGAVYVPGARAPIVVGEDLVRRMKKGSVIVDVAIDQGGCIATSHPTTHADPTFFRHGVVHYCVTNIPGIVPRTSTYALTNATLPYVLAIADKGLSRALSEDRALAKGLNVARGEVVHPAVAGALGLPNHDLNSSSWVMPPCCLVEI